MHIFSGSDQLDCVDKPDYNFITTNVRFFMCNFIHNLRFTELFPMFNCPNYIFKGKYIPVSFFSFYLHIHQDSYAYASTYSH